MSQLNKQQEILDRKLEEIDDPYTFQTVINTLGINLDQQVCNGGIVELTARR